MQQILAYESDILEYGDLFDGSKVIEEKVEALKSQARDELKTIDAMGGAIVAVEQGTMKQALVASNAERLRAIEAGERVVVGVNAFIETEPSPLGGADAILTVPDQVEFEAVEKLKAWRRQRDARAVEAALGDLKSAAQEGRNVMEPSIACARAGVTTGEWGGALREVFGEYRAPTGVTTLIAMDDQSTEDVRKAVAALSERLGVPFRFLVGKPGLDGHSNGAEQIAVRASECGIEVAYEGIRLTPAEIVTAAAETGAHAVGLSILSGSHVPLVREVMNGLRSAGLDRVPVVVGGIIPAEDVHVLKQLGVARVYTPKDFRMNAMLSEIVSLVSDRHNDQAA